MVVDFFINILSSFLSWYVNILPQIPNLSSTLMDSLDTFLDLLVDNSYLVSFFIRPLTFKSALIAIIAVLTLEELISYIMWVIKKIPVSTE